MGLLDKITLTPTDLENIMDAIQQKKHNAAIEIIDTNGNITIRDLGGFTVAEIKKDPLNELPGMGNMVDG